jgi:hypothetical protein
MYMTLSFSRTTLRSAWLIGCALFTVSCITAYGLARQGVRGAANYPQIDMAEEAAAQLADGVPVSPILDTSKGIADIAKTSLPFMAIYSEDKVSVGYTGSFNGEAPLPPSGVFEYALKHDQNVVTWQPEKNTRIALVVRHIKGKDSGYLLVGKSLRAAESQIASLTVLALIGWFVGMALSFLLLVGLERLSKQASQE